MYGSRLVRRDGNQTMTDIQPIEPEQPRKRARARRQPDEVGQRNEDFINFDEVVSELKQIVDKGERDNWRLGELAYRVEPRYGDKTLAKLAKENGGIAECTLRRRRNVYQAWKIEIQAATPESFSVAQELQAHPERGKIIEEKPRITTREARQKMRDYNEQKQKADPNHGVEKMKTWLDGLLTRASRAMADADWISNLEPEQRNNLKKVIKKDLKLLDEPREAVKAWTTVTDALQRLADEPAS
jgi:hypothetical protein